MIEHREQGDLEGLVALDDAVDRIDHRMRVVHFLDRTCRKAVVVEMRPMVLRSKRLQICTGIVLLMRSTRCVFGKLDITHKTELYSIPYGE